MELGTLAGVDLKPAPALGAEVFGLGAAHLNPERVRASLRYSGDLHLRDDAGLWLSDAQDLSLSVGPLALPVSGVLEVSGSLASDRWIQGSAAARLSNFGTPGPMKGRLDLGLGWRRDSARAATGLLVGAVGDVRLNPRARLLGSVHASVYEGDADTLLDGGLGVRVGLRPALSAWASTGLWAAPGSATTPWADQVANDELYATALAGVELGLRSGWSVPVELGCYGDLRGDLGPTFTLRAGVTFAASRSPPPEQGPTRIHLTVYAPGAQSAEVVGSFSGWQPVAMWRHPDGSWTADLELSPGIYSYVYRVDGATITPSDATLVREDEFGVRQGLLLVGL